MFDQQLAGQGEDEVSELAFLSLSEQRHVAISRFCWGSARFCKEVEPHGPTADFPGAAILAWVHRKNRGITYRTADSAPVCRRTSRKNAVLLPAIGTHCRK
jgi:hypothetical protein